MLREGCETYLAGVGWQVSGGRCRVAGQVSGGSWQVSGVSSGRVLGGAGRDENQWKMRNDK